VSPARFIVDETGQIWPEDEQTDDSVTAEVRRRQASRLAQRTNRAQPTASIKRSRWAHVPLVQLFQDSGNVIYKRASGAIETGHEPCHHSKGGRCVQIDAQKGVWWCRSCREGGDAVIFLRQTRGWFRHQAVQYLTQQYSAPSRSGKAPEPRPRKVLEA
jgi:hypothetical protein